MDDRGGVAEEGGLDKDPSVVLPGSESAQEVKEHKSFDHSLNAMRSNMSTGPREKWGSKMQFMMSCIASAVGLGNRVTYLACHRNFDSNSLFVLELTLGQFTSKGSVRCWDMSPIFTGIGVAGAVSSVLLSTFYIMLLAWALIYAVVSFVSMCSGDVLWGSNTLAYFGGEVLRGVDFNAPEAQDIKTWVPICHLVLALLVAWLLIWVTMVFGVEASGKVAYVTAMAPYVVLITLLVIGCCLPGASVGISYFIIPEWHKILIAEVSSCRPMLLFLGDVMIIGLVDTFTSILAGFSLLSILGFQASRTFDVKKASNPAAFAQLIEMCNATRGVTEDALKICQLEQLVNEGGAGVAFIQYPAAMYEVNNNWGRHLGGVGSEWFDVVDQHGVTAVVYVLSFLEVVSVIYCYGLKNFCDDIEFMREGKKVGWYLRITWVLLPFLMLVIFIVWLVSYKPGKTWTPAIRGIAWTITGLCLAVIPATAIHKYIQFWKNPWRRNVPREPLAVLRAITNPSPKWGPKEREIRQAWKDFKAERPPSYRICRRIIGLCGKSDEIPVDVRVSYATNAGVTGRPSESGVLLAPGANATPMGGSFGSLVPASPRDSEVASPPNRISKG
ncbi:unnamed protein product [Orchesella dallaii]|uniref:Uncharacterized protein n=1 Tax=Orchesella dallaii TaxID=48710 RepID=A0ABP1QXI7_9HEXA